MKINFATIDQELRPMGRAFKLLNISFSESKLRLFGKLRKKRRVKVKTLGFHVRWIPREDHSQLRLCVFTPQESIKNIPGVLWLHGGGFALGAPEQAEKYAKQLISASPCVVVAPDYRRSVEAPYPAALDDSYTALVWMKEHAQELGIRDDQLMVGGDSAGGGLTAALTHLARDRDEVSIAFQMPLYPMLDDRMRSESAKDNHAPVWDSKSNRSAWKVYLGDLFGSTDVPEYAAPARAKDYHNLPPAVTFVGDLEPFRDETIAYVDNLRKAGVPVQFEVFKGCYHAFEQFTPKAKVSQKALTLLTDAYTFAVDHYFAEQHLC